MDLSIPHFHSVTVFGGATVDRIATCRDIPVAGASNPGTLVTTPGGVGFNLAIALARLGMQVRLVSRVGDDTEGLHIVDAAQTAGIDTRFVARSAQRPTASYIAAFDPAGSLIIGMATTDINDEMSSDTVSEATLATPAGDLWVIDANLPAETLRFLLDEARNAGRPVAAMPVSPAKAVRLIPFLAEISLLFANRIEAAALLGQTAVEPLSATELASQLTKRYPGARLVITDADKELAIANGGTISTMNPLRAEVRSVNGGGDALAAGTIFALSLGRPFRQAIRYGLAAAAMTVESTATIPAGLTAAGVAQRLDAYGKQNAS